MSPVAYGLSAPHHESFRRREVATALIVKSAANSILRTQVPQLFYAADLIWWQWYGAVVRLGPKPTLAPFPAGFTELNPFLT